MTIVREFFSDFVKIKRTPLVFLHLVIPIIVTILFLIYFTFAGYHIILDVRSFFILLQIGYPIFAGIVVPVFINIDRNISGIQNALGLTDSRSKVYLGKLLFLLFFSAISMILYEVCFYLGTNLLLHRSFVDLDSCIFIFFILLFSNLFIYLLHIPIALRFGSSISVLVGICGTILAGLFENPIGDSIWPMIPWEWGIRFLKSYFGFSQISIIPGIAALFIITLVGLGISLLWYRRWEGGIAQE